MSPLARPAGPPFDPATASREELLARIEELEHTLLDPDILPPAQRPDVTHPPCHECSRDLPGWLRSLAASVIRASADDFRRGVKSAQDFFFSRDPDAEYARTYWFACLGRVVPPPHELLAMLCARPRKSTPSAEHVALRTAAEAAGLRRAKATKPAPKRRKETSP